MTTKQISAMVDGMTRNLTGDALEAEILKAMEKAGLSIDPETKPTESAIYGKIVNEYRQHAWDVEDLAGPAAPATTPATKKAGRVRPKTQGGKKPAAKKAAVAKALPKHTAKKAVKKSDAKPFPKPEGRTERMFVHVLAGKSNAAALALILKEFPGAPTNVSSIGWVRSQLRNNPKRWDGKYGVTIAKAKAVKADKDCK